MLTKLTLGALMLLLISVYIRTTNGDPHLRAANANFTSPDCTMGGSVATSSPSFSMNQAPVSQSTFQYQTPITGMPSPFPDVAVPDVVKTFASNFIQGIEQDQIVKNAFAVQRLTADEAEALAYDITYKDHARVGGTAPEDSARLIAESIKRNHEYAMTETMVRLFAQVAGKYLFKQSLLSSENAIELSQLYLEKIRNNVNSVIVHTPEADSRAVVKGYIDFLNSFDLLRQDTATSMAIYFTNELNGISQFNAFS